jgi:RNA polymerase sigma-70 factor, ECF subfamily
MHAHAERDEWLMAQVAVGERAPLETLVRRYAGPLVSFLARMVRDRHRSEELFQEVFLAVWLKRRQYQFPRPFKPWLYAIAVNKCRAAFRAASKALPAPLDADDPPAAGGAAPVDVAIAAETSARVARAIAQLPPRQRAVVALRVWDELSYGEIARVVGCTEATARSHMAHGLRAVRGALGDSVH